MAKSTCKASSHNLPGDLTAESESPGSKVIMDKAISLGETDTGMNPAEALPVSGHPERRGHVGHEDSEHSPRRRRPCFQMVYILLQ
jgi:hypothetical protein